MIQCGFVVKQMLWINQKGFLNYKRYYFLGGGGTKAVLWVGSLYKASEEVFSAPETSRGLMDLLTKVR